MRDAYRAILSAILSEVALLRMALCVAVIEQSGATVSVSGEGLARGGELPVLSPENSEKKSND